MARATSEDDAVEFCRRHLIACRAIGLSDRARLLATLMITDQRPWPLLKLSTVTGYSRTAIRDNLSNGEAFGITKKTVSGWVMTVLGRRLLRRILTEIVDIADGGATGFSDALMNEIESLKVKGKPSRRLKVSRGRIV